MELSASADFATAVGIPIGAASLIFGVFSPRIDHNRSEKALAIYLILKWNESVLPHRRQIDSAFPGLLDENKNHLTEERALNIYGTSDEDGPNWELRFSLIEILIFFEAVVVVYNSGAADKKLIEDLFKETFFVVLGRS